MNKTAIKWTDFTWNPVSGCEKVSAGCKYCYAENIAETKGPRAFPNGFSLTYRPHRLLEPLTLAEPRLMFVNSMSDMFWDQISDAYRDKMMDVIDATWWHQYQVLTKRPEAMLRYSLRRPFPPNFWAGVTAENQDTADRRLPILRQVEARIRFVSVEPMLGPVHLGTGLDWVIGGGESGLQITTDERRALVRRVNGKWLPTETGITWMRDLRDQCLAMGARFFFKQWGGPTPKSGGRDLDGRTWDEFPEVPS